MCTKDLERIDQMVERLALASIRRTDEGDLDAGIALLDAALALRARANGAKQRGRRSLSTVTRSY